jgi:hypothetical protein
MAIYKNVNDYEQLLKNSYILDEQSGGLIYYFGLLQKIVVFLLIVAIVYGVFQFMKNSQDDIVFNIISAFIPAILIIFLYFGIKNYYTSKLDLFIFENLLTKKVKIFYSPQEALNYDYKIIGQISKKLKNTTNTNQIIIEICYEAYTKKAHGIIITQRDKHTITTGTITNDETKNITTDIQDEAEVLLIKDINKKE